RHLLIPITELTIATRGLQQRISLFVETLKTTPCIIKCWLGMKHAPIDECTAMFWTIRQ
ncbi:hypothetical protein D018_4590B, partial [Vibrio parahaemolyticus VP2007-007]